MKTNFNTIVAKISEDAAKLEKDNEKFAVPNLASRARKAALAEPADQTLQMLASVLKAMDDNRKLFISRAEFNNVFEKFASRGTKARGYFADELNASVEGPDRKIAGWKDKDPISAYAGANKELSSHFSEMWNENGLAKKAGEVKSFSPVVADRAEGLVRLQLTCIGAEPQSVKAVNAVDNFIVCAASYDRPTGSVNLLVPVETADGKMLIPNSFVTSAGYTKLTKENVTKHIDKTASRITEKPTHQSQIKVLKAKDTDLFAQKLASPNGVAEFKFGERTVDMGRLSILSKLSSLGFEGKVSVASCDSDSITYAVVLESGSNKVGFEVMAEVQDGKTVIPGLVAVNDRAYDFTHKGISTILKSNASDTRMVAAVSPAYALKPNELLDLICEAADKGLYKEAEEALTVLSTKGSNETYEKGLKEYMRSVRNAAGATEKNAAKKCGCNLLVKSATHSLPLCGHLNLPIDKVYQNERGQCCPLYRKAMNENYEPVMFNTSVISKLGVK